MVYKVIEVLVSCGILRPLLFRAFFFCEQVWLAAQLGPTPPPHPHTPSPPLAAINRQGSLPDAVKHVGLFTFPSSTKHLHLYEKYGFRPRYLARDSHLCPGNPHDAPVHI